MAFPKAGKIRVHVDRCPFNGKRRFTTQLQADTAITIPGLYSYSCTECSGFHLTHIPPDQKPREPAPRREVKPEYRRRGFTLGDVARIIRDDSR